MERHAAAGLGIFDGRPMRRRALVDLAGELAPGLEAEARRTDRAERRASAAEARGLAWRAGKLAARPGDGPGPLEPIDERAEHAEPVRLERPRSRSA